jgi:hypothetical protein
MNKLTIGSYTITADYYGRVIIRNTFTDARCSMPNDGFMRMLSGLMTVCGQSKDPEVDK